MPRKTRIAMIGLVSLTLLVILVSKVHSKVQYYKEENWQGGGGGVLPMWIFTKLSTLNTQVQTTGLPTFGTGGIMIVGGGGYGYLTRNVRVGILGGMGTKTVSDIINTIAKKSSFSLALGGFTAEYVLPYRKLNISFGAMIGGGRADIKLSQWTSTIQTWEGAWDDYQSQEKPPEVLSTDLSSVFLVSEPFVGAEYQILNFAVLKVVAGFLKAEAGFGTWKQNNNISIPNSSKLNLSGSIVKGGIYFGF